MSMVPNDFLIIQLPIFFISANSNPIRQKNSQLVNVINYDGCNIVFSVVHH